ncbi:MAG: hypothetical protein EBW68_08215, partial [Actinobacteria bacterium]|nr:hypothetical protein [Actinomycetota bacterium]
ELHDRNLFEVHAFSFNICAENDTMRPRLQKAFDHWHDVQDMSDLEVTTLAHSLEIDIAINLNGHTLGARNGIFAHRAAPIQINYLGYPGTMGAEYMDYILADRIVIPEESQKYYSEKVIYLPDCYHVTDSTRYIPDRTVTRADYGLPEDSFIYACFNANFLNDSELAPEAFAISYSCPFFVFNASLAFSLVFICCFNAASFFLIAASFLAFACSLA